MDAAISITILRDQTLISEQAIPMGPQELWEKLYVRVASERFCYWVACRSRLNRSFDKNRLLSVIGRAKSHLSRVKRRFRVILVENYKDSHAVLPIRKLGRICCTIGGRQRS
jgi:hypothetical protein